jgi:muramoyltetrapeptide carboxypeptidase LdcA involved in peptidoglycan recycling
MIARQTIQQQGYIIASSKSVLFGNKSVFIKLVNVSKFPPIKCPCLIQTSEDTPDPQAFEAMLVQLIQQDALKQCNGMIIGKPFDNVYYTAYKEKILDVLKQYNFITIYFCL